MELLPPDTRPTRHHRVQVVPVLCTGIVDEQDVVRSYFLYLFVDNIAH